ncbi:HAD family hydrolase [Streptomyces sp. SID5910]|uniref:HAD family hydrolase n=1 Tax=Streptomyces sp. SID5910 TaxID=2690312 RepID=UPI00136AAF8B|nr:HAD family hydrolase [Streptomyces sp. SID5910]MYR43659.1 HAD-IA family hydrolase [Streptomyces sp. SID5910]
MESRTDGNDPRELATLLHGVRAVLFDFDGPVCDLFRGASTADVARRIKDSARYSWKHLDPEVSACDDSHGILRKLRAMYERPAPRRRDPGPLARAEEIVREQEAKAALTAVPTPLVDALIPALVSAGMRLVVVSNNAEKPIRDHLVRHGLDDAFEVVCGRDPEDARRMKPHPDCVDRALAHLGLPAAACLLIGDQLTDLEAARAAGTPFLGFTRDDAVAEAMLRQGADAVVSSYTGLVAAVGLLGDVRVPLTARR